MRWSVRKYGYMVNNFVIKDPELIVAISAEFDAYRLPPRSKTEAQSRRE